MALVQESFPEAINITVVLGDQYLITKEHISDLLSAAENKPDGVVATNYDGSPGVPACFPKSTWSMLFTLQGDEGARRILESVADVVLLDIPDAKFDMDVPFE